MYFSPEVRIQSDLSTLAEYPRAPGLSWHELIKALVKLDHSLSKFRESEYLKPHTVVPGTQTHARGD
jgi:hypothetical protein